jgi:fused signal recognition particle receptor
LKLAFWRKSTNEEKVSISAAAAPSGGGILQALRRSLAPEPDWSELERALIQSDAGTGVAAALISAAREAQGGTGRERLRIALLELMREELPSDAPSTANSQQVILLVGVNGAGKTTSAAKLAARAKAASLQPILVAADTFRAAAIDQLRLLATREGVPIVEGKPGGDPSAAIHDALTQANAKGFSPVIIDTAGRMQTKAGLMDELTKIRRVIQKLAPTSEVEVLLVIDATAGQNGLAQASGFNRAAGVDGVILTKLDAGARGGVALAVRRELGLPVRWVGVGERGSDLLPFDADAFVDGLLGDAV